MNHIQIIADSAHRNYVLFNPTTASSEDVYTFIEKVSERYPNLFFDVIFGGLVASHPLPEKESISSIIKKKNKKGEVNNFATAMKKGCIDEKKKGCFDNVAYHWVENRMKGEERDSFLSIIEKKFVSVAEDISTLKKKSKGEIFKRIRETNGNLFESVVNSLLSSTPSPSPEEKRILGVINEFKNVSPERYSIALKVIDKDLYFHKTNSLHFSLNFEEFLTSPVEEKTIRHFAKSYFLYLYDLILIANIENLYVSPKRPPLVKNVVCYNEHRYNALLVRYLRQLDVECFANPEGRGEDFVSNVVVSEIYSNDWEILDLLFSEDQETLEGCTAK